jgi:CBS domain-containing protein
MRTAKHYQGPVATIAAQEVVSAAAERMRDRAVGSLVVTENKKPVGIVTDRDLMCRVVARGRNAAETRVADVMSAPLASIDSDVALEEVVQLMARSGVRRVPVVHQDRLEGLVSLDDVLVALSDELDDLAGGARRGFRDAQRRASTRGLHEVGEGLDDLRHKLEKLGGDARESLLQSVDEFWDRVTGR